MAMERLERLGPPPDPRFLANLAAEWRLQGEKLGLRKSSCRSEEAVALIELQAALMLVKDGQRRPHILVRAVLAASIGLIRSTERPASSLRLRPP